MYKQEKRLKLVDDTEYDLTNDENSQVIDFVEYKLMRQLHEFPVGSPDWEVLLGILEAYLGGEISVHWSGTDTLIQLKSGSNIVSDELIPVFVEENDESNDGEDE